MLGVVIKANKTCYLQEFNEGEKLLDELQEVVGGYIEAAQTLLRGMVMVCNEEGQLLYLPVNMGANAICSTVFEIVGYVVILLLGSDDLEGVPEDVASSLLDFLNAAVGYDIREAKTCNM